jgi:hypothetical protein
MANPANVEYTVVLVFPGFGTERENAEQVVEEALQYLNTQKTEPGFRFASNVFARLEMVTDGEQAQARLRSDDNLAMMILHALPEDERAALTEECAEKGVPVCHTLDCADNPPKKRRSARGQRRQLQLVFRKATENEPRAHKIPETTLTASPENDEEEWIDRIGQLIAVMALGVMEFHWTRHWSGHDVIH